jgi:hypothetical protein
MKDTTVTCGACGKKFKTNEGYLRHKCKATGFTPRDVEHFDALSSGRFSLQSKAALARGKAREKAKK